MRRRSIPGPEGELSSGVLPPTGPKKPSSGAFLGNEDGGAAIGAAGTPEGGVAGVQAAMYERRACR